MKTELLKGKNGQINIILKDRGNHVSEKPLNKISHDQLNDVLAEFSSFIGLQSIKEKIAEIYAVHLINQERIKNGLKSTKQVLHKLFRGNPGTGKTTFARQLAKIYFDLNILSKGHFIEAERADLVGEYIGQTAQKTRELIEKAIGGVLFIDEAYSLARGGEKDFGREAIDTLVAHMENECDDLVIILAGYPNEMNYFLSLNPGLESRFPFVFDFEDFTLDELIQISHQMYTEREYELTKEAEWKLKQHLFDQVHRRKKNFANARYVRNIVESSIRKQAVRLLEESSPSFRELMMIQTRDLDLY